MKLLDLLKVDENAGTIHLNNRRVLIIDADAFGLLRKELIETLGMIEARRMLSRFGYMRGYRDALTSKDLFHGQDPQLWSQSGVQFHSQEGIVRPELEKFTFDPATGVFEVIGQWKNSFEAEQHIKHLGKSETPTCWTLMGYASGFQSVVMGREVFFLETSCVGRGDKACRFIGTVDESPEGPIATLFPKIYQVEDMPEAMLRVRQQRTSLKSAIAELEQRSKELADEKQKVQALEKQVMCLQESLNEPYNFEEMIGANHAFRAIVAEAELVAQSDSTVLITGETGTGKELLARAVHARSLRASRPLITVNCAALPAGLVESELFGHEKGAFTGAVQRKPGRFELANKGTIFLDEIGELPPETQSKFLRVLQEGTFERVGSSQTIQVDVRVIAATNQPLDHLVEAGKFRPDLFYRLNVFPLHIPPLRERENDIVLLTNFFIQKYRSRLKKKITAISQESIEQLKRYSWPGNIRELEHIIERAVLVSDSPILTIDPSFSVKQRPVSPSISPTPAPPLKLQTLEDHEREYISQILKHTNGMIGGKHGAAEILGVPSTTLRSRMQKLGMLPGRKNA
ncbi:MAG TPA: sigma 54-interacting transcriptional regulator [Acidobacteriota bacterium]|nr:sigma 54-interacting transcriptional regulator [Acidobacteriota bacterium]HNB71165.1 sigma 54-interacting transcriptional regulator [Acidobacteriota bacterium]HNG93808.1 sigma 54-interacting transcriptional regulator [Acidobacteriota bacterium]